jgi:hypothetical protein
MIQNSLIIPKGGKPYFLKIPYLPDNDAYLHNPRFRFNPTLLTALSRSYQASSLLLMSP